jgi:hypothetical protein
MAHHEKERVMSKVNVANAWALLLVVACSLLISAATAHAECAWVFWQHEEAIALGGGSDKWATPIAYPDRAACVAVIDRYVKAWQEGASPKQTVDRMPSGTAAEFRTLEGRLIWVVRRYCLPDTVDPRGPKAK